MQVWLAIESGDSNGLMRVAPALLQLFGSHLMERPPVEVAAHRTAAFALLLGGLRFRSRITAVLPDAIEAATGATRRVAMVASRLLSERGGGREIVAEMAEAAAGDALCQLTVRVIAQQPANMRPELVCST